MFCLNLNLCLSLHIVLFSVTHVPRLVATAIKWPNWTETQKMRAEKIMKAMQRVEDSVMGPEVRL